ncbi:hypothetical protein [Helicobacter sp. T3_23-1059]
MTQDFPLPCGGGLRGWVSLQESAFLSLRVFATTLPKATKI